jgi:hypothetical protein
MMDGVLPESTPGSNQLASKKPATCRPSPHVCLLVPCRSWILARGRRDARGQPVQLDFCKSWCGQIAQAVSRLPCHTQIGGSVNDYAEIGPDSTQLPPEVISGQLNGHNVVHFPGLAGEYLLINKGIYIPFRIKSTVHRNGSTSAIASFGAMWLAAYDR